MPQVKTEYALHADSWYRGVNGKKVTYTKHVEAFDLAQAEQFLAKWDPEENPRIMHRSVTVWEPIDAPRDRDEIAAREKRADDHR